MDGVGAENMIVGVLVNVLQLCSSHGCSSKPKVVLRPWNLKENQIHNVYRIIGGPWAYGKLEQTKFPAKTCK